MSCGNSFSSKHKTAPVVSDCVMEQVREEEIEEEHRQQVASRQDGMLAKTAIKFGTIHASRIKTLRQLAQARRKVRSMGVPEYLSACKPEL